ncbi:LOW QUALITY PROTEIN: hypothetical protein V2J09_008610 [Rumex salicifolius]
MLRILQGHTCRKKGHMKKDCPKYVAWRIGCYLDLIDTFIALTFKRNLISTFSLDKSGFFCGFGNGKISISLDSNVIDTGILLDRLYMLEIIASHNEILHANSNGTKRKLNENSASLWHKYLGYIPKQRIQRFVSDGILDSLDLTDYQVCVNCVKEKLTNTRKLSANKSLGTNTYKHLWVIFYSSWNGQQYFITFINDYSRYGYLYLIREKSQSLDVFNSYKFNLTLVATSTMASEFMACFETSNHGIWLRNFVTGLRVVNGIESPLKLFCDNKSTVCSLTTIGVLFIPWFSPDHNFS